MDNSQYKCFINVLISELNDIKNYYNPTGFDFRFEQKINKDIKINSDSEIYLELYYGTDKLIEIYAVIKLFNEESVTKIYKIFVENILKYILFVKSNPKNNIKSIQDIITTIIT